MASFTLENGMSTAACRAERSVAEAGQHICDGICRIQVLSLLPARLDHARKLPLERELSEANAAQAELANVRAGAATALAAIVLLHGIPRAGAST